MNVALTLLDIVLNTPGGVLIYCPNVNEICREIYDQTGVMLHPEKQVDYFDSQRNDFFGDPYVLTRTNHRKYLLKKPL
jgi:hypothetical protein